MISPGNDKNPFRNSFFSGFFQELLGSQTRSLTPLQFLTQRCDTSLTLSVLLNSHFSLLLANTATHRPIPSFPPHQVLSLPILPPRYFPILLHSNSTSLRLPSLSPDCQCLLIDSAQFFPSNTPSRQPPEHLPSIRCRAHDSSPI